MPFNITETAQFTEKEILKFPGPGNLKKSVVLDATKFPVSTDGSRYYVPAGTLLVKSGNYHVPYSGSGVIDGILARPVDLLAATTAGDEPAPMWFMGCVFVTEAIVGFTVYASSIDAGVISQWNKFE